MITEIVQVFAKVLKAGDDITDEEMEWLTANGEINRDKELTYNPDWTERSIIRARYVTKESMLIFNIDIFPGTLLDIEADFAGLCDLFHQGQDLQRIAAYAEKLMRQEQRVEDDREIFNIGTKATITETRFLLAYNVASGEYDCEVTLLGLVDLGSKFHQHCVITNL